jgi:hypothetical protein
MADQIVFVFSRAIEVVFFSGLCGCALLVAVSWISIFRDGFTRDDEE